MTEAYEARCKAEAEAQGLTPYMETLDDMGRSWELWQTGGYCMVLAIPYGENRYITINDMVGCLTLVDGDGEWYCGECDIAQAGHCPHALEAPEDASVAWLEELLAMAVAR